MPFRGAVAPDDEELYRRRLVREDPRDAARDGSRADRDRRVRTGELSASSWTWPTSSSRCRAVLIDMNALSRLLQASAAPGERRRCAGRCRAGRPRQRPIGTQPPRSPIRRSGDDVTRHVESCDGRRTDERPLSRPGEVASPRERPTPCNDPGISIAVDPLPLPVLGAISPPHVRDRARGGDGRAATSGPRQHDLQGAGLAGPAEHVIGLLELVEVEVVGDEPVDVRPAGSGRGVAASASSTCRPDRS